jgi:hypothetical protein
MLISGAETSLGPAAIREATIENLSGITGVCEEFPAAATDRHYCLQKCQNSLIKKIVTCHRVAKSDALQTISL